MRTRTVWAKHALFAFALGTALSSAGQNQHPGQSGLPPSIQQNNPTTGERDRTDPTTTIIYERQAKQRNDERQRRLISDTEKLLELATQLHTDVGKTDKNVLSLDVIKRADEIEKLAHAVKERMKG